jgi:hypothetical protein
MCQYVYFDALPRFWGFDASPPDNFADNLETYKTARMQASRLAFLFSLKSDFKKRRNKK